MRRRAFTLIECMIGVAMLGILVATVFHAFGAHQLQAVALLQKEQASQLLQAEASWYLAGGVGAPAAREKQTLMLPGAQVQRRLQGQLVIFSVTWRRADTATGHQELAVLRRTP